jgi:hypothetical protein
MRKAFILLLMIIGAAQICAAQDAASRAKADIDALMTTWHKAAAAADEKTYFDLMAPEAIFLGTDATERWTKDEFRNYAESRFKGGSAWVYWATKRNIYLSSDRTVAWLDEELASKSYWTCRGTAALEMVNGQWKIRHYNLMFTIPNSAVREIKPVIQRELAKTEKK